MGRRVSLALTVVEQTSRIEVSHLHQQRGHPNKRTAAILQEGLLVFHYAVLESTNGLGRSFPMKFEFLQTGRQYEQDGNWFCQGVGRVKTIRPSTKPPSLK